MEVTFETINPKKLVGNKTTMTLADDTTGLLWQRFMPYRKQILHTLGTDLYSVQVYEPGLDFSLFTPHTAFSKWAAMEVSSFENIPENMETLELQGGLYAIFHYTGSVAEAYTAIDYIFKIWLPQSSYVLDQRPHFALMGDKYSNTRNDSEEQFWIPVKTR